MPWRDLARRQGWLNWRRQKKASDCRPSHVLLAIGLKHEQVHGSMIMTLGKQNNPDKIPAIANATKKTVERQRALSPL
jgi:cysteine sulfinate desulfinase/cysteine desulfurase-like protein